MLIIRKAEFGRTLIKRFDFGCTYCVCWAAVNIITQAHVFILFENQSRGHHESIVISKAEAEKFIILNIFDVFFFSKLVFGIARNIHNTARSERSFI